MIYERKYPSAASKEERRDIFSGKPVSDRRIRRPPVFVSGADG